MTVETITPYDSSPLRSLFALALVMMSSPEAEISCSCSGNQEQEFLDLIRREDSLISAICFSYSGSVAEYDDLRQDALINIWRGLPTFKGDSSSRTWIYRVVINSCVSTIRKQIRHTRASESLDRLCKRWTRHWPRTHRDTASPHCHSACRRQGNYPHVAWWCRIWRHICCHGYAEKHSSHPPSPHKREAHAHTA